MSLKTAHLLFLLLLVPQTGFWFSYKALRQGKSTLEVEGGCLKGLSG